MDIASIRVQTIHADWLSAKILSLDILRLDKIDTVVSGNKWFKLKHYLQEAIAMQKNTIATFGGAWSNHIIATAYLCKEAGLKSVGVIRGEQPTVLSYTLAAAEEYGMDLHFVTRLEYQKKNEIVRQFASNDWYWINEGGYGQVGAKGAAEILQLVDPDSYSHIIAAAGTGTMLAGLLSSAHPRQKVVGISSMKGNHQLYDQIMHLIVENKPMPSLQIMHDYHFGGYAKHPQQLIDFINDTYLRHQLPLDIVYTGKTFFAIHDLAEKGFFEPQSHLLMIHSGGLQGNSSLPPEALVF